MPDKGAYIHHMTHSSTICYNSLGIMYSGQITTLSSDPSTPFQFPAAFFMQIDVAPTCELLALTTQMIFLKKKAAGGTFLSIEVDKLLGNDMIITSGSTSKTISGILDADVITRIGLKKTGTTLYIYVNGAQKATMAFTATDALNRDMYIGGDSSGGNYNGRVRDLTIWSDISLYTFPQNQNIESLCGSIMRNDDKFETGPDYYWPSAAYFGTDWVHSRRMPYINKGWLALKDKNGALISDSLKGIGSSQTWNEVTSFNSKTLTLSTTQQAVKYYQPWTIEEYLIVTGDRSSWVQFSRVSLEQAISLAQSETSYPACIDLTMIKTSKSNGNPVTVKALFYDSGNRIFLGPDNLNCPTPENYNDATAPIYGEITNLADPLFLVNNIKIRNGFNVFIRVLPANMPKCGDGFRTYPEECDDGNTKKNDGCNEECKVEVGYSCTGGSYGNSVSDTCSVFSECGDGVLSGNEECDDNNKNNLDGCNSQCKYEKNIPVPRYYLSNPNHFLHDTTTTGAVYKISEGTKDNPALQNYWEVRAKSSFEGSNTPWKSLAITTYSYLPIENDGYKTPEEICDDGNTKQYDGCYNNQIEQGFTCIVDANKKTICTSTCGDGVRRYPEECDDGNLINGDGCNSECKVEIGYSCSGGNPTNMISDTCVPYKECGDGILDGNEECDDGNLNDLDGCSSLCKFEANIPTPKYYFDSAVHYLYDPSTTQVYYTIAEGTTANPELVNYWKSRSDISFGGSSTPWKGNAITSYKFLPILNDGYKTPDENCDDGNTIQYDGCYNNQIEPGWTCVVDNNQKSICTSICGDGKRRYPEECDDGNLVNGDGCNSDCKVEIGYSCSGADYTNINKDICVKYVSCGNNVVEDPEECDDFSSSKCTQSCQLTSNIPTKHYQISQIEHFLLNPSNSKKYTISEGNVSNPELLSYWEERSKSAFLGNSHPWEGYSISKVQYLPILNDGYKTAEENCDDGNNVENDGCHNGTVNHGWNCTENAQMKSECKRGCGEGTVNEGEDCDPPGYGCNNNCKIIPGYYAQIFVNNDGFNISTVLKCNESCETCRNGTNLDCIKCARGYSFSGKACIVPEPIKNETTETNNTTPQNNTNKPETNQTNPQNTTNNNTVNHKNDTTSDTVTTLLHVSNTVPIISTTIISLTPTVGVQSVFTLLEIMQLLSLFSLIGIKTIPTILQQYFYTLGMYTLEFLPNIVTYVTPESEKGELNEFTEDSIFKRHPSFLGKDFLLNIGNVITMYLIAILAYLFIYAGSFFCNRFQILRKQYENTVICSCMIVSFIEVFVAIFIYIKFSNSQILRTFSIISSICCFGFLSSQILITFKLSIFYCRLEPKLDENFALIHAPLLDEYENTGLARFTQLGMISRVAFVIPILIFCTEYPLLQTLVFLVSNFAYFIWNIALLPNRSKTKMAFVLVREFIIFAINIAYIPLCYTQESLETYGTIVVVFMVLVCVSEVMCSIIETLKAVINWMKRCCHKEEEGNNSKQEIPLEKVYPINDKVEKSDFIDFEKDGNSIQRFSDKQLVPVSSQRQLVPVSSLENSIS